MNLNPADKSLLSKYTTLAKKIIYNPDRMKAFLKMMGTKEGAVTAVQTVISAIDKLKPIPPQIIPMLAVNSYMIMVDVAQEGTGQKADPGIMEEVVGMILQTAKDYSPQAQPQAAPPSDDPGMLAQMQGQPPAPPAEDPEAGMLAQMQRRGVPA